MQKLKGLWTVLCGAFLLGMLWRMRGTHGWGSGWGLLASGFVFLLFLTAVLKRPKEGAFPLLCLTVFSFMLTTPGWGTLLQQITGVLTVNSKSSEETLQAFVHPVSGVVMMLLLGFGLASVFGVLCGRYSGCGKSTMGRCVLRLIEPQAAQLFAEGLQKEGITGSVYAIYMHHYGGMAWAKKILGGRHYFASVETIAFALQAVAVLLTTRFIIKDRFAARTGAVVCGSFALSITVSDLFFFFDNGGYRMQQGFALPDWIAAWSSWEYCTGFLAGAFITAYLLCAKPLPAEPCTDKLRAKLRFTQNEKLRNIVCFLLCFVGGIGANAVRPVLLRFDESKLQIPATVLAAAAVLAISVVLCRKYGAALERADLPRVCGTLCGVFVLWFLILYLFAGDAQIRECRYLHTMLVLASAAVMAVWFAVTLLAKRETATLSDGGTEAQT